MKRLLSMVDYIVSPALSFGLAAKEKGEDQCKDDVADKVMPSKKACKEVPLPHRFSTCEYVRGIGDIPTEIWELIFSVYPPRCYSSYVLCSRRR